MDSASSKTGEEESPTFLIRTADSNINCPKVVFVKEEDWCASLSLGKSDMIGCIVTAWNSRHLRQCTLMERKDDLSFSIV